MANEKKGLVEGLPGGIPGVGLPLRKKTAHKVTETQMLKSVALVDPEALLGGEPSNIPQATSPEHLLPPVPEVGTPENLLPATSSQEIDALFADVLPMPDKHAPAAGSKPLTELTNLLDEAGEPVPYKHTEPTSLPPEAFESKRKTPKPAPTIPQRQVAPATQPMPETPTQPLLDAPTPHHLSSAAQNAAPPVRAKTRRELIMDDLDEIAPTRKDEIPAPIRSTIKPNEANPFETVAFNEVPSADELMKQAEAHFVETSPELEAATTPVPSAKLSQPAVSLEPESDKQAPHTPPARSKPPQRASRPSLPESVDLPSPMSAPAPSSDALSRPTPAIHTTQLPHISFEGHNHIFQNDVQPRYEELKPLSSTRHTEWILAKDNDLQRLVALKRLKAEHHNPHRIATFLAEVQLRGQLDISGVTPVLDVGVDTQGRYYFVSQYTGGEGLGAIIQKLAAGDAAYHKRFPLRRRLQLFRELLRVLQATHALGIVHRDLKPDHILVGAYGEVTLIGWELAIQLRNRPSPEKIPPLPEEVLRQAQENREVPTGTPPTVSLPYLRYQGDVLVGTPAYMSPEQAEGRYQELNEKSDIYSLSVILYEWLTLQHPYESDKQSLSGLLDAIKTKQPLSARSVKQANEKALPAPIAALLDRGLSKSPLARPARVEEMLHVLSQQLSQGPEETSRGPLTGLTGKLHESMQSAPLGTTLLLLLLLGCAILGMGQIGLLIYRLLST